MTVVLYGKSDGDEAEFLTNHSGSRFCTNCPVVVFEVEYVEKAAMLGIRDTRNLGYEILSIVDLMAVPEDKRHFQLGVDGNPVPIVEFLPEKRTKRAKRVGRNETCPCGSGKKFKKCCGV